MIKSYWFVHYSVCFNVGNDLRQINGNSVHELDSQSFLPNNVIEAIRKSHMKILRQKELDLEIIIKSFGKIDQIGFADFSDKAYNVNQRISMSGREYSCSKRTIISVA